MIAPGINPAANTLEAAPLARDAARVRCALGAGFWVVAFAWLWVGAPWLGRVLGTAWFALGALWPAGFIYSLALAFPWFGNNPGGPHHLYLIEMGLMGLAAGHLLARARGAAAPRPCRLDLWVWLFAAWSTITVLITWRWIAAELAFDPRRFLFTIFNHYGTSNTFSLQLGLKLWLGVGLYVYLRDRPWPAASLRRWLLTALGALAFTALAGLLNYYKILPLAWWREENPFLGLRFGYARLQSLYWHSGWLAQYIEALGPAALALALGARRATARALLIALAALLAVTQFLTMARAGWIGLAGGYAVVIGAATLTDASPRRLRRLALRLGIFAALLASAGVLLAVLNPDFRNKLGELFAWRHRSAIWNSAVVLSTLHPLTGCGLGDYFFSVRMLFPEGHPYWAADNITAHNLYLHILAERGAVGLALFLIFLLALVQKLLSGIVPSEAREGSGTVPSEAREGSGTVPSEARGLSPNRPLTLALLGGLTALTLDGLFQYTFYVRVIEVLFWLIAGWTAGMRNAECGVRNEEGLRSAECGVRNERRSYGRRAWAAGGVLLAAGLLIVAFDYPWVLGPAQAAAGGKSFYITSRPIAMIPVPEGARKIRFSLMSLVPNGSQPQPVQDVSIGGQPLARVEFKEYGDIRTLELELPGRRDPDAPLAIHSSVTWSLWTYGQRELPCARMGVLYTLPEKME